ncbi:hypothetical protein Tsubulata_030206 [Turnera subulata]|uniref:Leucine-rich repeat-containing N-terminal plant-type domain-containing protein n=1 Tax=Turnera subulata TaxID=218843 RepID=A0A9Q0G2Q8_9ROSI|nr:hypothetical protein Tsubulata_030206 [Turnera subulata]
MLDLSSNNLSGNLPKSLEELKSLVYFNVSFNALEGEIPSGGRFIYFTAGSFTSNKALCRPPRLQVPPCSSDSHHGFMVRMVPIFYWLRQPCTYNFSGDNYIPGVFAGSSVTGLGRGIC